MPKKNELMDPAKAFDEVYEKGKWNYNKDGSETFQLPYYSGDGSHYPSLIIPYMDFLRSFIKNNQIKSILEVGCGDFYIMNQVLPHSVKYTGIDVSSVIVKRNTDLFSSEYIKFIHGDASSSEIDIRMFDVDLVICRQVLQHCSNSQVSSILDKCLYSKYSLISESTYHTPSQPYNIDMHAGQFTRNGSGLRIDLEPFNYKCACVLSVTEKYQYDKWIDTYLGVN